MIRTGTMLDMDMTTLGASLREGWGWWTDELARMVPERWLARPQLLSGAVAEFGEDGTLYAEGSAQEPVAEGSRRRLMHVVLPPGAVMVTRTSLPRLGSGDLARVVALELDRLLPFPPGTAIAAAQALPDAGEAGQGKLTTLVAGLPTARAAALVETARAAGIEPLSLSWRSAEDERVTLDLLPALVASGHITARRDTRPFWWGLVAALFVLNGGLMIWRDVAATTAFAEEVAANQTTSTAARALAGRIARETALRKALVAERDAHDPLSILALTTVALPEGAWVQRYAWTPESLRLTGTKPSGSDIPSALRRTGRFAAIQASVSDPTAESGGGQPFDVTATLGLTPAKEGE
ncbi:MAG: hypothetical protein EDM03_04735 [Porphyrobacter sp. IPPAS B-1204]|nr:MAG: hypothetical protein EDM03_04735 [Porphyrobacter sp. IPPAS B-1204]